MSSDAILKRIQSSDNGILQNELWKALDMDSRKCSRIVSQLLARGLITREPVVASGKKTFILRMKEQATEPGTKASGAANGSVLELIRTGKGGILQNDLWKSLGMDSRKCSRIVSQLVEQGLITREPEVSDGKKTFRLRYVEKNEEAEEALGSEVESVLDAIKASDDGVLQNELWKSLGMDSRKCSRIVSTLLERKLITKEQESHKGKLTFRLRYAGKERHVDFTRFECLVAGSRFSPCTGCTLECTPESCDLLLEWIGSLGAE